MKSPLGQLAGGKHIKGVVKVLEQWKTIYKNANEYDYAAIYSGALGLFIAGDPFDLNPRLVNAGIIDAPVASYAYVLGNPSDAVPPMGMNSIAHPAVNIHGLYTEEVASEMKDAGMIPLWEVIPTLPPVP